MLCYAMGIRACDVYAVLFYSVYVVSVDLYGWVDYLSYSAI